MSNPQRRGEVWLVAAAALAAGPGLALLYETGNWSLGLAGTLWPVGFVVVAY